MGSRWIKKIINYLCARQVGKTYLVLELFVKKYYKDYEDDITNYVDGLDKALLENINNKYGIKLVDGNIETIN